VCSSDLFAHFVPSLIRLLGRLLLVLFGAIARLLGQTGTIVLNDLDPGNLELAQAHVHQACEAGAGPTVRCVRGNFADLPVWLENEGLCADLLLADLGFASTQVDDASRGLSFSREGPLDMRLDPDGPTTAADLIADLDERELADLIYEFGEERLSRRIARKIVESRGQEPIMTTGGLAKLVRRAYPRPPKGRRHRIDPATRTFMALRIAVNDELGALDGLLRDLPRLLKPGGRAAVISFHSLEDRRVKRAFLALGRDAENPGEPGGRGNRGYRLLTRKPVTASDDEAQANPRSRSAKMRVIERPA